MTDFQALLFEGVFSQAYDGGVFISRDDGSRITVLSTLNPLQGQRVKFALHHLPPKGLDPALPGGGACLWAGGRGCPVGHATHPERMLSFHEEGVLEGSTIRRFDGGVLPIPFSGMDGHYGRLAAVTVAQAEAMRDALQGRVPEVVGQHDLEQILADLRRRMGVTE